MGIHKHRLPASSSGDEKWGLWVRDGANGAYIKHDDSEEEIEIPRKLILMMVAHETRLKRITELEQMEDIEILGLALEN